MTIRRFDGVIAFGVIVITFHAMDLAPFQHTVQEIVHVNRIIKNFLILLKGR